MAEEIYGPAFEIHGGGLDLVFPHHENEVAQSRALGHPFASIWAHNGMLSPVGDAKMSKSLGNVTTIREVLDEWGREAILVFFLTASWRKPIDFSEETMAQAAARRDTLRNAFTLEAAPLEEERWDAFAAALDDDFDTPAALAVLHEWAAARQLELLERGLDVFGLASLAEREEAPPEVAELAERRSRARAERDFETSDRLRDELAALGWQMRDEPGGGYTLVRVVTPDLVYGRRCRARGAARPREVLEVWATERAVKAEPWLAEAQPELKLDRDLSERAETRDHQGVLALVEPYRYADAYELAAARAAAPRGARPGHRPAQPRRRLPERGGGGRDRRRRPGARLGGRHAGGRARVGGRDRASADRGRDEPRPLPRGGEGRRPVGVRRGGRGVGDVDVGHRSLRRRRDRARRGGEGSAAARPPHVRRARLDPARGPGRVAERLGRRGGAACTKRVGSVADLYLFDGYNLLHAGGFADARELRDALASYVAVRGARGIVVFDGLGDLVSRGPLEVRYAPNADAMLERLAAEHRRPRARRARDERRDAEARLGHGGGEGLVGGVRGRARAGAARRGAAPRPRGQARRGDARTAGAAASRRVSGSIANRACALCGTLLHSSRPKGEGSLVQDGIAHPKTSANPGGNRRGRPHRNRSQVTAEGSTRA